MQLSFSIDLEAELKKIAEKQHLNAVHFLVALVRHALNLDAKQIHIHSDAQKLVFSQDGDSFPEDEWRLLLYLLLEKKPEVRQIALSELETNYGIAILSLFVMFPNVVLTNGKHRLISEGGQLRQEQGSLERDGYTIEIKRSADLKEERRELNFYCSHSEVPIIYNQKKINQTLSFDGQILISEFKGEQGQGAIGIPEQGELCSLTYYKRGIRLGVKQYLPLDGRVFHGLWNSSLQKFEVNFNKSIQVGDCHMEQFAKSLYDNIPKYFKDLSEARKQRVKHLLLQLSPKHWGQQLKNMGLFHSGKASFTLSLADLESLEATYEEIPYILASRNQNFPQLPKLSKEDIYFVSHKLKKQLKPVSLRAQFTENPTHVATVPVEDKTLSKELRQLLNVLNAEGSQRFFLTVEQPCRYWSQGKELVFLPMGHPELMVFINISKNKDLTGLLRYQILAWFDRQISKKP